jgi:elongation factor Ts
VTAGVEPVRELRERTGAGIMDCKAALQESHGDMEKAIDFLRKKGMASAAKRSGREAKEGLIAVQVSGVDAVLAEANCETDFVARTEDFKSLLQLVVQETFSQGDQAGMGEKVTQRVAELSGKIGEKILVRRVKKIHASGVLFSYVHSNQKLCVVLKKLPKF